MAYPKIRSLSLLAALMLLLTTFGPVTNSHSYAQGASRTFTETGKTVNGRFLEYWNNHGGLTQQGFPISEEFNEVSDLNGQSYKVQYFERAVFEWHPEFATPNNVLLSQLGTFRLREKTTPTPKPPTATPRVIVDATATAIRA